MKMLRKLFASLMLAGIFVTADVNAMIINTPKCRIELADHSLTVNKFGLGERRFDFSNLSKLQIVCFGTAKPAGHFVKAQDFSSGMVEVAISTTEQPQYPVIVVLTHVDYERLLEAISGTQQIGSKADLPDDYDFADVKAYAEKLPNDAPLAQTVDLSRAVNAVKACGCVGLLAGSLAVGENSHYISFPMFWAGLTGTVYYGYKTITGSK